MADFDFNSLKLADEQDAQFDYVPFDHAAGQAALKKQVADALRFVQGTRVRGMTDVSEGYDGALRYRPTLYGQRIGIVTPDEDYYPIHKSNFATLVTELSKAIENGKFNDQIEAAAMKAAEAAEEGTTVAAAPARSATKSGKGRTYSENTRAISALNGFMRNPEKLTEADLRKKMADHHENFSQEAIDAAFKRKAELAAKKKS